MGRRHCDGLKHNIVCAATARAAGRHALAPAPAGVWPARRHPIRKPGIEPRPPLTPLHFFSTRHTGERRPPAPPPKRRALCARSAQCAAAGSGPGAGPCDRVRRAQGPRRARHRPRPVARCVAPQALQPRPPAPAAPRRARPRAGAPAPRGAAHMGTARSRRNASHRPLVRARPRGALPAPWRTRPRSCNAPAGAARHQSAPRRRGGARP
ncbi:MAG: hypothetical protein J3K34DRAFT_431036 [Monoraphidium minutum]|nr:MAG: hypothetical protein J3K34DRAFT_431036 [Monoraphidium minutum]